MLKKVAVKKITPKTVRNDDRTGSMTGSPSPKERAAMEKKMPITKQAVAKPLNYHEKAQKFITSAKTMGMKVSAGNKGQIFATPKVKPTNLRQTTPMIIKKNKKK